jgi:putative ABC transport system permease protein
MYNLQMGGTEEGYAAGGTNGSMIYGRFFSDTENRRRLPVVVIGEDVYKALFASGDPVGKVVDVDGHALEVVGVISRPSASMPGQQDSRVLFPYHTMQKLYPNAKENMVIVVAYPGKLAAAEDEVTAVLRVERRVPHNKPDNFALTTSKQMVDDFRRITSVTTIVMVVLSSIGLLVGGIGVMNIMLVSVTERTREIGIRKAIGARRFDIVVQFLTEAVVLTGLGGCIGMMFGWLISLASRLAFPSLPTTVPLWAAALGIVVSVGIGVFFGIWPANKAAHLDPVEALRYE